MEGGASSGGRVLGNNREGGGKDATPPVLLSPAPCGSPPPFLLVLVPSAPGHGAQRQAIRDTWARGGRPGGGRGERGRGRGDFGAKSNNFGGAGPNFGVKSDDFGGAGANFGAKPGDFGGADADLGGKSGDPRGAAAHPGPHLGASLPRPPAGGLPTRTLFVVGVPGDPQTQGRLQAEGRRYGDLLQGDFQDSYSNLTLKTLLLLRWAAAHCPSAPFLLKADDDVFVNLPSLTSYLATFRPLPRLYLGRLHWWVRPDRDPRSRHHVPAALYPSPSFPLYCSGTAYVLSSPALGALLEVAPRVPLVAPEDVWVGLCARRAGIPPRHSARMGGSMRVPPDPCCYGEVLFSSHRVSPDRMRRVWGELGRGEGACGGLQRALGVLRCKVLAAGQWLWE